MNTPLSLRAGGRQWFLRLSEAMDGRSKPPGKGSRRVAGATACRRLALVLWFLGITIAPLGHTQTAPPVVLVSMAPLYSLAKPLVAGTNVALTLVPDEPRSMQAQATLFTRQADRFAEQFKRADAVITMGKIWSGDPLYTAVREVNIRVVNIDASKPWSHELDGVAVANSPVTQMVSPYFWLSPSNVIRMLDIIGSDLVRLYPQHAVTIAANLAQEKANYLMLKNDFERRLVAVTDPVVYALTDQFVYLTSDLGVFVEDYFVKQDIDWTDADYLSLASALENAGVRVVLHQWEPSDVIKETISRAGAQLLVLDSLETTTDFRSGLEHDFNTLLSAFTAP